MAVLGRGITGLPLSAGSLLVGIDGIVDELPIGLPGQVLSVIDNPNPSGNDFVQWANPSGGNGAGDVTGAQNLFGSGAGIFSAKDGTLLQFRRISSGSSNVVVNEGTNEISISVDPSPVTSVNSLTGAITLNISNLADVTGTPAFGQVLAWNGTFWTPVSVAASGETNTASNIGTGTGVFSSKNGVDLLFKSIKAGDGIDVSELNGDIIITNTDPGSAITGGLTSVGLTSPNSTLTVGNSPLTANGNLTVDLPTIVGVSGSYTIPSSVTVDGYGRVTAISSGTAVNPNKFLTFTAKDSTSSTALSDADTFTFTGTDINTSITGTSMSFNLANVSGLTPGSYTLTSLTVDAKGRITSASNGTLPNSFGSIVTDSGTGLAGTPGSALTLSGINGIETSVLSNSVRVSLSTTGVTAGTYGGITGTAAQVTVDTYGRITAAQNKTVLQSISGDLNPALGGNLNIGPYEIGTSSINGNLVLRPNGTGTVDVSGSRITNLATPVNNSDAATKAYVDLNSGGGGGSPLSIDQDGTLIDSGVTKINFTGTGINVTQTATGEVQVDISGSSNPTNELIEEVNVSIASSSIVISNIPSNYDDLYMVIVGNVDGAVSDVYMSVNGDTGTNYGVSTWTKFGSENFYGIYPAKITTMEGSTIYSNLASETTIDIPGYNLTGFGKKARATQQYSDTDGIFTSLYEWNWENTSAINSITLTSEVGNFAPGTIVRLYGRGGTLSSGGGNGAAYLDDLLDVSISSEIANQVLLYNGTFWVNSKLPLAELLDVSISTPSAGQNLVYDGTDWVNQSVINIEEIVSDAGSLSVSSPQISVLGGSGITTSVVGNELFINNAKTTLASMNDVIFSTAPVANQFLQYTGTEWSAFTLPDYALNSITEIFANDTNSILASSNSTSIAIYGSNGISTSIAGNILTVDFAATLSQVADINITALADGHTLIYDQTTNEWKNAPSTSTLAGMSDVDVTGISDNFILKYNDSLSTWQAVSPSSIDQNVFTSVVTDNGTISALTSSDILTVNGSGGIFTSVQAGDIIIENQMVLNDITDVDALTPSIGQVLAWDGTAWSPAGSSSVNQLNDLSDVIVSSPISDQVLLYNGSNWVNSSVNTISSITGNIGSLLIDSLNKPISITGTSGISTTVSGSTLQISLSATLDDLSDVNATSPTVGDTLYWSGSSWSLTAGGSFSLISDPNPTLGADLNTNGFVIGSNTDENITIIPGGAGETQIGDLYITKSVQIEVTDTDPPTIILTYDTGFVYMAVDYYYTSTAGKRIGTLLILNDGTDTSVTDTGTELGLPDVEFTAIMNGTDVEVTMTTPDAATIKFTTRKMLV